MIRVLIAEDQAMVRGALAALLRLERDIEVVAEVDRGDAVLPSAQSTQPDVALLDIELPGGDGLTAAAQLRAALPSCRVMMLTTFGRVGYLRRAMDGGAVGFLLKDEPAGELASAIRRAMNGERIVDPELALSALVGNEPADAARTAGARCRDQRIDGRRNGRAAVPVGGNCSESPLGGDSQGGREESRSGRANRRGERLVVAR